jgi:WD40 repeat protein/beta-lactamase regulating signal transducer with metallopeptidase domain
MRLLEDILAGGAWAGLALIHVTLVALLGLVAWLATRRAGPALRGAVLVATLVAMLLVPALAMVAPVWLPLPEGVGLVGSNLGHVDAQDPLPPLPQVSEATATLVPRQAQVPGSRLPTPEELAAQAKDPAATPQNAALYIFTPPALPPEAPLPEPAPEVSHSRRTLAGWLAVVWMVGASAYLLCAVARLVLLYRCARRARPVCDEELTGCLETVAERHGYRAIALRECPIITSPLTLGVFRPVILLPTGWRSWPASLRTLILSHELAHVRRGDFLAGLLAELAACLCWFHPLVRWLTRRLRLEQEYAADAWVAAVSSVTDYVRCLARLALERGRGRPSLAPAFGRRRAEILRRIDMLRSNPNGVPHRLGKRAAWMVTVFATVACLAVAGVGPLSSAGDDSRAAETSADAKDKAGKDLHGDALPAEALARLGTNRLRHAADITFVTFGPDGKTLITAGRDNTIRLWDLTSGKELRRFTRPQAVDPRKAKLNLNSNKGDIEAVMQLMAGGSNQNGRFSVALAPDGKVLAASSFNAIRLWDIETGKELRTIKGPPSGLAGLLFSPDGRVLAGRASGGGLFLWAADTGKEIRQIQPPPRKAGNELVFTIGGGGGGAEAPGMAFTPDSKNLVAALAGGGQEKANNSIKLWDVATGQEIRRIKVPQGARVAAVAVAPAGKLLAYATGSTVHYCDVDTGNEIRQLKAPDGRIATLVFSPDCKLLAARGRNQKVRAWDAQTGKELHQLGDAEPSRPTTGGGNAIFFAAPDFFGPEARALAISPDGKRIASAAGRTVRIWDTTTGKEISLVAGHRQAPAAMVVSPDGKSICSWGSDGVIRRWEAATGRTLSAFAAPPRTTLAAFARDGRIVALANADNTIRLHDTVTGKEVQQLQGSQRGVVGLAFAPGGNILAARSGDNVIRLFDVAKGTTVRQIGLRPAGNQGQQRQVIFFGGQAAGGRGPGLAFSPDGKLLLTPVPGNVTRMLAFHDVATGKELRRLESPLAITGLAFSPNGRCLATQNSDRTISLWEVASARERSRLGKPATAKQKDNQGALVVDVVVAGMPVGSDEPPGPVSLAFSPNGKSLASRGPDNSVCVWDVDSGQEIRKYKGHSGSVQTVAFSPDGRTLASGAGDTTILLWDSATLTKNQPTPQRVELPATDVEALWGDLAGQDAAKAYRGLLKLAGSPGAVLPFLSERLKPAARVDQGKIDGWIVDLESPKFAVRDSASTNLFKVGEQAVPALHKVLKSPPSLETSNRVAVLLDRLTNGNLNAEQLRMVRAVEALERIGSQPARQLLQRLAGGAPGALLTREAQDALDRLGGP